MSQPLPLQASAAVWRSRALRYTTLYVVLVAVLLGLRYATRYTYRDLRELRVSVADLQLKHDQLELEVQTLTTGPRILAWATAQGMVPYAQASKTTTEIQALPPVSGYPVSGYPAPINTAPINTAPIDTAPINIAPEPLTASSAAAQGSAAPSAAPAEQTSSTDPPSSPDRANSSAPAPIRPRLEVTTQWK
ncbi:hypothetical protein [Deinococcus sp.]|uniref:hypothetical protein n=1 Tax=Deinococcus sp. TaxID=47478 RepID=UPI0025F1184A|nr:hypothetical protein [Deinococcus sp.]